MVEEANYATLKNLTDEDLELMEDEDSHYALVRQPDGKADEPEYSSLRYDIMFHTHFCIFYSIVLTYTYTFLLNFLLIVLAHSFFSEALHAPSDDGGYESLQHRTQPIYVGIDSRKFSLSLLDNTPNYLVGCVIQKRYILFPWEKDE